MTTKLFSVLAEDSNGAYDARPLHRGRSEPANVFYEDDQMMPIAPIRPD